MWCLFLIVMHVLCYVPVDLAYIARIESAGDPAAYNVRSGARGLYQITPICLADYNQYNTHQYMVDDMFDLIAAERVALWYINRRIPQLLRHYNRAGSTINVLVSYNAGISYIKDRKPWPAETKGYVVKYYMVYMHDKIENFLSFFRFRLEKLV